MTRTAGAPIGCQRPSRFWGLGCPKIYHEAEDTLGINPNLTDYIEPTSQHGLDKYPPHVPTIYKNTHLASIEQT
ncbi:hypothetical protein, partial [Thiolapillus sp.]|uniref:hypothetical protein n=1 Tax=Thiolapillus sp. TaxID=2017437 RepID=UPI003AF615B4